MPRHHQQPEGASLTLKEEPASRPETAALETTTPVRKKSRTQLRTRASDFTTDEKLSLEATFKEKLRPAIEKWSRLYAGHVPFRVEEVTLDKFVERLGKDPSFYSYTFVLSGTTLCVDDYNSSVFFSYLWAPAARQLTELPTNAPPPASMSVATDEIMRLLKADLGTELDGNEISIKPTGTSGAMNGGVMVDVGKNLNAQYQPLPVCTMVFGPDGNLACYGR
jgi:hypothetical protein